MMLCAESFWSNLDKGVVFWVVMGVVAVVWIASWAIQEVLQTRAQEQTKREIAAYLAEGSIDKETALAMLKGHGDQDEGDKA